MIDRLDLFWGPANKSKRKSLLERLGIFNGSKSIQWTNFRQILIEYFEISSDLTIAVQDQILNVNLRKLDQQ